MAKKRDKELFDNLRQRGVRKKVAKAATEAAATAENAQPARAVAGTVANLKQAAADLERHAWLQQQRATAKAARARRHAARGDAATTDARTRAAHAPADWLATEGWRGTRTADGSASSAAGRGPR